MFIIWGGLIYLTLSILTGIMIINLDENVKTDPKFLGIVMIISPISFWVLFIMWSFKYWDHPFEMLGRTTIKLYDRIFS